MPTSSETQKATKQKQSEAEIARSNIGKISNHFYALQDRHFAANKQLFVIFVLARTRFHVFDRDLTQWQAERGGQAGPIVISTV